MTHCDHSNRARVDALAERIAIAAAHIDSATRQLLADIRELDELGGWALQGAKSCAQWLAWRIGVGLNAAREMVRTAKALGALPLIDEAMRQGKVSYSKVRAMTRVAAPAIEARLLEQAECSTGAQLERICRGHRSVTARTASGAATLPPDRRVHARPTDDGMVLITAKLRPDEAEIVTKAIREAQLAGAARRQDAVGEGAGRLRPPMVAGDVTAETSREAGVGAAPDPEAGAGVGASTASHGACVESATATMSRADALVALCESFLAAGAARSRAGGERTLLVVQVRDEHVEGALRDGAEHAPDWHARLADSGAWIDTQTLSRLACDASLVMVRTDAEGHTLDVGRRRRTLPGAIRRALGLRDHGRCCYPGCDNQLVDGHHVRHWAHGGETKLQNLASMCQRHHSDAHEGRFRMAADGKGGFRFFDRFDRPIVAAPCAPPLRGPGAAELASDARNAGLSIDARTSLPHWDGARLDLAAAVGGLLWRAARGAHPEPVSS